jgi:hypothetical protein
MSSNEYWPANPWVWKTQERVRHYLCLLASTGKSTRQLERFGKAYLRELLTPDPRYSGC